MIDRKRTWTATQQDQQHRRPLDMGGPGDKRAGKRGKKKDRKLNG